MATKERAASNGKLNAKQRAALARVERGLCITCENKPQTRGQCFRCNAAANAAIGRSETTDEKLVAEGLRLPRKRLGRPAESGFVKAMRSGNVKSKEHKRGAKSKSD